MLSTEIETELVGLLDSKALSERLRVPLSRIRYEVFKGTIPHIKIGRTVRFSPKSIEEWIKQKSRPIKGV